MTTGKVYCRFFNDFTVITAKNFCLAFDSNELWFITYYKVKMNAGTVNNIQMYDFKPNDYC